VPYDDDFEDDELNEETEDERARRRRLYLTLTRVTLGGAIAAFVFAAGKYLLAPETFGLSDIVLLAFVAFVTAVSLWILASERSSSR
jgi:hypothetical protein